MTTAQYLNNLQVPATPVDVVLDTDAYNEIDDQFAISYLLCNGDRLNIKGFCAAPFYNHRSSGPADGMLRSYHEIIKLLKLAHREDLLSSVHKGSETYLPDEETPVPSDSADFLAALFKAYTPDKPLYIIAIGAITNVASALLMDPGMKDRVVIVWLGGNGHHREHNREFNLLQDVAAGRVVFGCGAPVVQLPCDGVVDRFTTSQYELEHWLLGKNELCDYLVRNTIAEAERFAAGKPWTRVIWDVTAVAWLLNDQERFMSGELVHSPIPEYDHRYAFDHRRHLIHYVSTIHRDALFADLFEKLAAGKWGSL